MPLLTRRHDNFLELKAAWQTLESRSACSLFTGWHWQQTWWQTWGEGLELQLYSFCTSDGTVVGIAPLFARNYRFKRVITLRQLQAVGNLYPSDETVLSEYLDLIVDPDFADAVHEAFLGLLNSLAWDELALPMITTGSHYFRVLATDNDKNRNALAVSIKREGTGISIATDIDFASYIATLGKNTRLKLYNRRTLLAQQGAITLTLAHSDNDVVEYLDELNRLASARWGRPLFGAKSLRFHRQLAQQAATDGLLRLSRLQVNDVTVSLLYNLRLGATEYNIQAAYDENFHAKISPGTLHLGYAIEEACASADTRRFDLLFGSGKNDFYKKHFKGDATEFVVVIAMKSAKAKLILSLRELYRSLRQRQAQNAPQATEPESSD